MMVMRAAYIAPFSRMRDDNYVIQYGQDPSYQDLSPLHTGPSQLLTLGHHQLLPLHSVAREFHHWRM